MNVSLGISRAATVAALASALAFGQAAPETKAAAETRAAAKAAAASDQNAQLYGAYLGARTAQHDHDWKTAGALMRRVWAADRDDPGVRHDALLLSIASGDFPGAVEISRTIPSDSQDAALAGFVLTLDDFAQGRYAAAQERLASAPARGLDRYLNPLMTAWCEVGRGHKDQAMAALAGLDSIEGLGDLKWLHGALVAEALGDRTQAASLYGKLMDGKPSARMLMLTAAFYERQGEGDKARAAIERIDPDGVSASLRTELLARLAAKTRPDPAPDPRTGAADVLFEIASSLMSQQQMDVAPLLYLQFAFKLRPNFPSGQILLAQIDQRFGRSDEAAASLLAVDDKSALKSSAERLAMATLDRAGQVDQALKLGQAAVKAHPEDIDLQLTEADLLRSHAHYAEAIAAYDVALTKIPPTSSRRGLALFHRGMAYQLDHKWPNAETDLLAALQLRPDDPAILNYLGFSWADQGINLDRARTMIERAVELVPDDGAIIDSLGWVMYRAGDFDDAVKQLEHAVALDSRDAEINDHLGDAYWRAGRQIEARGQWEKATRLTDDKALLDRLRTKLRDGLEQASVPPQHASTN